MSEWKEYKISEISVKITSGGTPSTKVEDYYNGDIPWLNTKEVNFNRIWNTEKFITEKGLNSSPAKWIDKNSVIIAMYGATAAKVAISKIRLTTNQACCNLIIDEKKANYEFVFYYIWNKYHELENIAVGAAQQNLNVGVIANYPILMPSLPEQTAIASILSSLDSKIDLLHRQNATLEKMAETLFRQWFVEREGLNYDFGDFYDGNDLKNHSNQANQKNQSSDKAEVPNEEWEETILAKHTAVFRGLSYKGDGLTDIGLGLPMHNLNSVYEGGGYKHEGIKFYKGEFRERHLVNPGEIIVTNTEQGHEFKLIGFPAIVPDYYGAKGLFSQHIYKLIPLESSYLSNEFIYYLLMTPDVREQITSATNGSTVNMLAIDGLQRPKFKLPPKALVENFTSIVSIYWKKQTANQTQIRTLTALRDTLLPKLMSGEVRVTTN